MYGDTMDIFDKMISNVKSNGNNANRGEHYDYFKALGDKYPNALRISTDKKVDGLPVTHMIVGDKFNLNLGMKFTEFLGEIAKKDEEEVLTRMVNNGLLEVGKAGKFVNKYVIVYAPTAIFVKPGSPVPTL